MSSDVDECSVLVLLDSGDQSTLTERLTQWVAVSGGALDWFSLYLRESAVLSLLVLTCLKLLCFPVVCLRVLSQVPHYMHMFPFGLIVNKFKYFSFH